MPGMGKMQKQVEAAGFDDSMLRQQIALINSMTKKERANPRDPASQPQKSALPRAPGWKCRT